MCIIMRWPRNLSASWAERCRTFSLLCTYRLCDYYSPIPILSPFLFTPSLYVAIFNLQDFSFTCIMIKAPCGGNIGLVLSEQWCYAQIYASHTIPIYSYAFYIPSLYSPFLNLKNFSFTSLLSFLFMYACLNRVCLLLFTNMECMYESNVCSCLQARNS